MLYNGRLGSYTKHACVWCVVGIDCRLNHFTINHQFKTPVRTTGYFSIMKTQVTISKKQENKGVRGILDLTSQIGQVLKQFEGIYNQTLPDCDGLTVEGWMEAHGVHRFIAKNGRKKGYTPTLLMEGWHFAMQTRDDKGKVVTSSVFKNVPAKVVVTDPNDPEGKAYRVFTKEEAEKEDGKPISRYMLVEIPENKWSVATILRGLKQSTNFAKENEKATTSEMTWEQLEHVYIVKYVKMKSAETGKEMMVRKVVEVSKDRVQF